MVAKLPNILVGNLLEPSVVREYGEYVPSGWMSFGEALEALCHELCPDKCKLKCEVYSGLGGGSRGQSKTVREQREAVESEFHRLLRDGTFQAIYVTPDRRIQIVPLDRWHADDGRRLLACGQIELGEQAERSHARLFVLRVPPPHDGAFTAREAAEWYGSPDWWWSYSEVLIAKKEGKKPPKGKRKHDRELRALALHGVLIVKGLLTPISSDPQDPEEILSEKWRILHFNFKKNSVSGDGLKYLDIEIYHCDGRPYPSQSEDTDERLVYEMHNLICAGKAKSVRDAATKVVKKARRTGTIESAIKRLERKHKKEYGNPFPKPRDPKKSQKVP